MVQKAGSVGTAEESARARPTRPATKWDQDNPYESGPDAFYRFICDSDPLLLKPETQELFGAALLRHLLHFRPGMAVAPVERDLLSASGAGPSNGPTPPDDEASVVSEYLNSVRERRKLDPTLISDGCKAWLKSKTMVCEGERTAVRKGLPEVSAIKPLSTLRIAAICRRVSISPLSIPQLNEHLHVQAFTGGKIETPGESLEVAELSRTSDNCDLTKRKVWLDDIRAQTDSALTHEADIVVLPEFALPHPIPNGETGADAVETTLREVCVDRSGRSADRFIFCGSRHEGFHNRGLIFQTGQREGRICNDPVSAWHYKIASARAGGENILAPRSHEMPSYVFEHEGRKYRIVTPICYDVFDPAVFLSLLSTLPGLGNERTTPIVIVPSFNRSKDFISLLRELSFVAKCIVIYADSLHGESWLFVCGIADEDLTDAGKRRRVVETLTERISTLDGELQVEYQKRSSANNEGQVLKPTERDYINSIEQKKLAAEALAGSIRRLDGENKFLSLVSTELCRCEEVGAQHIRCGLDTVYFDVDLELLSRLERFRESYFLDDRFLPAPWRALELRKAWQARAKREKERKAAAAARK